jgi:hypothetical protein
MQSVPLEAAQILYHAAATLDIMVTDLLVFHVVRATSMAQK